MDPLFSPFHSKRTSGPFFQFSFSHFFARGREYINQEWTEIREGKPGLASFKIQSLLLLAPRTKESPAYFLHRPNPKVTSLFMYFAFSPSNSSFGGLSSRDDFPSDEAAKHDFSSGQDSRLLYLSRSRHRGLHKKVFCDRFRETGRSLFFSLSPPLVTDWKIVTIVFPEEETALVPHRS